eukprot:1990419-Prymnesium_polylepis.1
MSARQSSGAPVRHPKHEARIPYEACAHTRRNESIEIAIYFPAAAPPPSAAARQPCNQREVHNCTRSDRTWVH